MTVRLRAHHLLCMLTFIGKGYTPEFTENYRRIAARLSAGETIELVTGPDDICAPLAGLPEEHCLQDSVTDRDTRAAIAVSQLLNRPVVGGSLITARCRYPRAATPRLSCRRYPLRLHRLRMVAAVYTDCRTGVS